MAPVQPSGGLVTLSEAERGRSTDALPAEPAGRYDVVVFSIIDWSFRFQRPQQIATQFGRHGHRVLYLSTTRFLAPGESTWGLSAQSRAGRRASDPLGA